MLLVFSKQCTDAMLAGLRCTSNIMTQNMLPTMWTQETKQIIRVDDNKDYVLKVID